MNVILHTNEITSWHNKRIDALKDKNGWLSLAGLFWLEEGEYSFGSDPSNDFVFPAKKAPDLIGRFILNQEQVIVKINHEIEVLNEGEPVTEMLLQSDEEDRPTILSWGSLKWFVIRHGDKFAIRLKDSENPKLNTFKGIGTFPIDLNWRVKSIFEPYHPPKKIPTPTILGTTVERLSPGGLAFEVEGKTHRLDPVAESDSKQYFIIFADETNGTETYGPGRFLYVERPGEDGTTYIDFNKAYNPPCAFTDFATCPLPPAQNHLPIRITAGEKNYEHGKQ
jgi:uncharacterized protein (DUF1684 family)